MCEHSELAKSANIFGEALRIRVKKFKQNLTENYSKSTKIAITSCKFSKIFRGSMPPDPSRAFLVSQSASNLFCRKKIRLKKCGSYGPSLLKFLATPVDNAKIFPQLMSKNRGTEAWLK